MAIAETDLHNRRLPSEPHRATPRSAPGVDDRTDGAELEPIVLISPSPWTSSPSGDDAAPTSGRGRPGPLGADAYWRMAFSSELTDSIIMRTLTVTRRPSPSGAPMRTERLRLPPRVFNQLGAAGLAPIAVLINAGLRAADHIRFP